MGRGGLGKIVGRDDRLSRFAGRPGLRFQFIGPGFRGTEIDRSDVGPEVLHRLARRTAQDLGCVLMEERKIGRRVRAVRRHALQRVRHFRRIFLREDRTLHAMTIETPQQSQFLLVRARRAQDPLAVRHLKGQNVRRGLREPKVELRGAGRSYRCLGRRERVPDGAHGDVVVTGGEPVFRKTVLPLRVGADRNHDGRAGALGADHNAFHLSFFARGHGAGQRRRAAVLRHRRIARLRSAKPAGPCSPMRRRTIPQDHFQVAWRSSLNPPVAAAQRWTLSCGCARAPPAVVSSMALSSRPQRIYGSERSSH